MGWRRGKWPALAILVLLAVIASDFFVAGYWASHPMLTAIVSAMAVVLVSVAVIDAVRERRGELRWRILAQYALLDLVLGAHTVWVRLATEFEVNQAANLRPDQIQEILRSPDRAPAVRTSVAYSLADGVRREKLRRALEELSAAGRQQLTDWAPVMTGSKTYAELFDQHVELYGQIRTGQDFLHFGDWDFSRYSNQLGPVTRNPPSRWRKAFRRGVPPPSEVPQDQELFIDGVLSVINQAAGLQNQTWTLALRVAPVEWWLRRIDERVAAAHSNHGQPSAS